MFQTFNGFLVDLASGRRVSDHVDTLLIFLFELGILLALKGTRRSSAADRRHPRSDMRLWPI